MVTELSIEKKIQHAVQSGPVMIYGAHLVAVELYRYLKSMYENFDFAGFAVTSAESNPSELENEKVTELCVCQAERNTTVFIAMPERYHSEAEVYARKYGFISFLKVTLEDMSELKGKALLGIWKKTVNQKLSLYKDRYDTSWLNMADVADASGSDDDLAKRHYKFPTLYYLDMKDMFYETEKFDFYRDYERVFGVYHNLHAFSACERPARLSDDAGKKNVLMVYMVFSQWDGGKSPEKGFPAWIYPIQAGSALTECKARTYLDETGESISERNKSFAEMTAAYWVWKNAEPVKYKGLCHYRRHFVLTEEAVMALEENGVDVILTTPRFAPGGIGRMFQAETPVKEAVYQAMLKAVHDCHPEDVSLMESYMGECLYCPNNMVIARSGIYDAYCEWIFPVLFRMAKIDEESGYGHESDRHIAYAAELLTSYFFVKHKGEYLIAVTDYRFSC